MAQPLPPTPSEGLTTRLQTEFGDVLLGMLREIPGGIAGVLNDEQGDAIDFAHDRALIAEIDVQLFGAQIGQAVLRTSASGRLHGMPAPLVVVEAELAKLISCAVGRSYTVTLMLDASANVAAALRVLDVGRASMAKLL